MAKRGCRVVVNALPVPRRGYFLLAHELFHVLSGADSRLRVELYVLLGFRTLKGFEYAPRGSPAPPSGAVVSWQC